MMKRKIKNISAEQIISRRKALTANGKGKAATWTRVSSEEQFRNNNSIDTQLEACHRYCDRCGKEVKYDFGGTFESAKKAGEKFLDMVGAVLNDPEIDTIVVYDYDRFSRNMEEGLTYKGQLNRSGVTIIAVNQPVDKSNMLAEHIEAILLIVADIDNAMRRHKCHEGMVACLNRGEWYSRPPLGYASEKVNKQHIITINDKGHILKKAWEWIASEPDISQAKVIERLKLRGLKIDKQRLSKCLHNRFYCGKIEHQYLNGAVVDGKQEKLVSEALFNKVLNIIDGKSCRGYEHAAETPRFPLKGHIYYEGHLMTGYTVKKKDKDYYKYNGTIGNVNVSAQELHAKYLELLNEFSVPTEFTPMLVNLLKSKFAEKENVQVDEINTVRKHLATINTYIKTAKKNFAIGKIDEDAYSSALSDLEAERRDAERELEKLSVNLSNLAEFLGQSIEIACKLGSYWRNGAFEICQKIQKLVFPDGVIWNKENRALLTKGGNLFFDLIRTISANYKNNATKKVEKSCDFSTLVAGERLELSTS